MHNIVLTKRFFTDHLLIINALIKALLHADHEFVHWHQNLHLIDVKPDSCKICSSPTMEPATRNITMFHFNASYRTTHSKLSILFRKIMEQFLRILESECICSYDSVHEIAEIALTLLGSAHCCTTLQDVSVQEKLLQVGMSTFIHSSAMPLSFQPASIKAVLQRPCNTGNLETFNNSFVQCFLGTDLSDLNDSLKANLLRILDAIEPRLLRSNILYSMYLHCTMQNICSVQLQCDKLMSLDLRVSDTSIFASEMLKTVLCLSSNTCYILRKRTIVGLEYQVVCTVCDKDSIENTSNQSSCVIMFKLNDTRPSVTNIIHEYSKLFHSDNEEVRMNMVNCLPSIANHFSKDLSMLASRNDWPKFFIDPSIEIRNHFANILHELLASVQTEESQQVIVNKCLENLRTAVTKAVSVQHQPVQASVVLLLLKFSTHQGIKEDILLRCFKMQLIFLLRIESEVAKNAMIAVTEMCVRFGTNPKQLFDWYKDIIFSLLIDGAVANFMEHELGLNKTLANVSFCLI